MPLQDTLGSFASSLTASKEPIGGYYFGTKTTIWETIGFPPYIREDAMVINDMVSSSQGTFTVGTVPYLTPYTITNGARAYMSKLDSKNNPVWTVTLGSTGNTSEFTTVKMYNNYLYVFGYSATGVNTTLTNYYPIIAKYDTDGTLIWQKKLSITTSFNSMAAATMDASGNMYIALQTTLRSTAITFATRQTNASSCRIIKMLEDGTISWQSQMGYNQTSTNIYWTDVYPLKLQTDSSNNVYMLAKNSSAVGAPSNAPTTLSSTTAYQNMVVKFNSSDGTVAWQNIYFIGQNAPNVINDIAIDASNNLYICGVEYQASNDSTSPKLLFNGGFTIKVDPSTANITWYLDLAPNIRSGTTSSTTQGTNWKALTTDGTGNIYLAGSTIVDSGGTRTNIIAKLIDPGSTAPTGVAFNVQTDIANYIKVMNGRIFVRDFISPNSIMNTWPLSGKIPNPRASWPSLPLTYNGSFTALVVCDMTGGANPASYWRVVVQSYGTGGGTSVSSSSNTLSTDSLSYGNPASPTAGTLNATVQIFK